MISLIWKPNSQVLNICLKKLEDTTDKFTNPNPVKVENAEKTNLHTSSMVLEDMIKLCMVVLNVLLQVNGVVVIFS